MKEVDNLDSIKEEWTS
ncbi:UBX domain containing 4, isoform CRA_c [Mus musculus]|nr:UBX domain containing 4, isoform CRA_c [Mus musculus]